MIYLSRWVRTQLHGEGSLAPELSVEYPEVRWAAADDRDDRGDGTGPGRHPIAVDRAPPALLSDYRFPLLSRGVPVQVADYRDALRACHDLRLSGVVVPIQLGIRLIELPGSARYWEYLHGLAADLGLGARTVSLETIGRDVVLSGAEFGAVYRAYRLVLRNNAGLDEFATRGRIEAAQTIEQLDAIRLA